MVEFYINGQQVEVQLEDEQTVGDVLKSFESTCEENDAAVIGIAVDSKQITAELFDEEAAKPLGSNTKFEFSILQSGKNAEVSESIKRLADSIEQFCHVATLASLFPDTFSTGSLNGISFKDFFAEFSPILKDFEDALQNNDTVMLGDLSEYEICPRLKEISKALQSM